jgi:hypothetical protein
MKTRNALALVILGWCLWMGDFLPPNLTADEDTAGPQFVCFDSPEQCNLIRHSAVARLADQSAINDMSELQQYAQCYQYADPHANPPDF